MPRQNEKGKSKTLPKSFRIDESAIKAVEIEAASLNISPNTLVNQILKQYSEFDRFARKMTTAKSGKVDLESFMSHIRSLASYAQLFEFSETADTRGRVVTLIHDFGLNWSIFLVHYITEMFAQIGLAPKIEMSDRSVIFNLSST
jgi:hypothetical protein